MTDIDHELEEQFAVPPADEGGEELGADLDASADTQPTTSPPPSAEDDGLVEIPGHGRYKPEDLAPYARIAQWAQTLEQTNPDAWAQIVAWEQNGYQSPQPAATTDEDEEFLDPAVRPFVDRVQALEARLRLREQEEAVANMNAAVARFRTARADVTDEDLDKLWGFVREHSLLPGFLARNPDKVAGVQAALEAAYRNEFFDRARTSGARAAVQDIRDRRRAGAVGSSQRSAPRLDPKPSTPQEKQQSLVASIAEALEAN